MLRVAVDSVTGVTNMSDTTIDHCLGKNPLDRRGETIVRRMIRGANCHPSATTRALHAKGIGRIKIVTPDVNSRSIKRVATNVTDRLSTGDCLVLLKGARLSTRQRLNCLATVRHGRITNVVLLNDCCAPRLTRTLGGYHIPIIMANRHFRSITYICGSSHATTQRLTRQVLSRNHEEVICVNNARQSSTANIRHHRNIRSTLGTTKLGNRRVPHVYYGTFAVRRNRHYVRRLLIHYPSLSNIIYIASAITFNTVHTLQRTKQRIKRSINLTNINSD